MCRWPVQIATDQIAVGGGRLLASWCWRIGPRGEVGCEMQYRALPGPGGEGGALSFLGPDAALRDGEREGAVASAGIPHTIVRAASVADRPGGESQLSFKALSSGSGSSEVRCAPRPPFR